MYPTVLQKNFTSIDVDHSLSFFLSVQVLLPYSTKGQPVHNVLLFLKFLDQSWFKNVFQNSQHLSKFVWILLNVFLIFIGNFTTEIFNIFICCKYFLSTMFLHLTESCPENAINSDIYGDISTSEFFVFL